MTTTDTQLDSTSKQKQQHRNTSSRGTLRGMLRRGFEPSEQLSQYLNEETPHAIDTRDFGLYVDNDRTALVTVQLTVVTLYKELRCDHALVYYFDDNTKSGFAELQEKGDLLTPMSINELQREFGHEVIAELARAVVLIRDASVLLSSN